MGLAIVTSQASANTLVKHPQDHQAKVFIDREILLTWYMYLSGKLLSMSWVSLYNNNTLVEIFH